MNGDCSSPAKLYRRQWCILGEASRDLQDKEIPLEMHKEPKKMEVFVLNSRKKCSE